MPIYGETQGPKLTIKSADGTKELIICLDDDGTFYVEIDGIRSNVDLTPPA
jgi:hypothetical protein